MKIKDLLKFYYHQRVKGFDVPDEPHFDSASTEWFVEQLTRSKMYLEFGAGGSTLVAARRGIPTITVENDRFFANAVRRKLAPGNKVHMIIVYLGLTREWGIPVFAKKTAIRLARWRRYIDEPFEHIARSGHGFPDLVLVDGRFRRACALEAARQGALAGKDFTLCVDDYGVRKRLPEIEKFLGQPVMHGRMAEFAIDAKTVHVPQSAVDEAAQDFK